MYQYCISIRYSFTRNARIPSGNSERSKWSPSPSVLTEVADFEVSSPRLVAAEPSCIGYIAASRLCQPGHNNQSVKYKTEDRIATKSRMEKTIILGCRISSFVFMEHVTLIHGIALKN